jgi:short-subunit dehydrogenase
MPTGSTDGRTRRNTVTHLETYGPWAVIAGGSEGLGSAFALQLAEAGVNLVLIARKPGPLGETAESARAYGVQVRTLQLDLLDRRALEAIRGVTDDVEVGLLVYNAGANSYGHDFVTGDLGQVQEVIDLNITAQLALTHHFGALMRERGRGGILLVGSLAGYLGTAHTSTYSAAKAFSRVFAEGLWLELREHGVHVLELVLGVTRTPAMERAGLDFSIPGLNVAEPDDVAREGLAHLPDGPLWVAGGNDATAAKRSGPDRAVLLEKAHAGHQRLLGR